MQFSTAAVHAAEEQREAASKEAHRQALFPTLSSAFTPAKPGPQNPSAGEALCPALGNVRTCVHDMPYVLVTVADTCVL